MEFNTHRPLYQNLPEGIDWLFYHPTYWQIQNYENPVAFTINQDTKLVACIAFEIDQGCATSMPRSPFGSLWINSPIPDTTFRSFLSYIQQQLAELDTRSMELTIPAGIYKNFVHTESWLAHGFQLQGREINQHIPVSGAFEERLHLMEQRKLRKLRSGKICFQQERMSKDSVSEAHGFIAWCREQQGLVINIDESKLKELCFSFDDSYALYTARQGEDLISVVITCRPTRDYQYYYLPATDPKYKKQSPMVGLVELIYEDCLREGIHTLDLGVSSVKGKVQQGLFDFKARLGGLESTKSVVRLEW